MDDNLPNAPWASADLPDAPWAQPQAAAGTGDLANKLIGHFAAPLAVLAPGELTSALISSPVARNEAYNSTIKPFFDLMSGVKNAVTGRATPEEETALAVTAAQFAVGGGEQFASEAAKAVAPIDKAFDEGVLAPAAVRLDAYARVGDPNGVRLEPPAPETKPAPIAPIQGSPFGNIPRSVAARTGVPEVDAVLNSPVTKAVIDNPVIDRSHDVPYMAGASDPINNPTVFIDRHVPETQTVGGVTFDPADPWAVHENVEQHTMDILIGGAHEPPTPGRKRLYRGERDWGPYPNESYKPRAQFWTETPSRAADYGQVRYVDISAAELAKNFSKDFKGDYQTGDVDFKYHERAKVFRGMDDQAAYRVAHFDFAEPAEQAWYRAHGIDQQAAEAQQAKWLPKIQREPTAGDVPQSLYKKPYPHDHVPGIDHEPVTETPPTPEESARGMQIVRDWAAKQVTSAQPMLQEAHELGVIGPEQRPSLNELPPRQAGQRVMAATRAPDETISGEPPQQSAWRARWEQTLDKMATPDDARRVINSIVEANDEFTQARQGDMRPVQVEQLADVTGLDSAKIDVSGTSAKIKTDAEMRNVTEAFRIVTDKIRDAAAKGDIEGFTEAELQRDLLLDSTVATKGLVALRAEFGRAGNRLQEFYKAQREAAGLKDYLGGQGRTEDDVRDRMKMIADTPPNAIPKVLEATRNQKPGWLFWTWQQGLISGLITHTKYLMVNTGTTYLERVVAPEVSAVIGKLRGENVSIGAPLYAQVGMVRGLPDAFAAAREAFKTGLRVPLESELRLAERGEENPEALGARTPYTQNVGPEWGIWKNVFNEEQLAKAAKVIGIPGRSANAIHTFYKEISVAASKTMRAYEAAFQDGAKGDQFWERYNYHIANPTVEAEKGAIDDAYSGAFMEKLGKRSQAISAAVRNSPLRWLLPFMHIPLNIARMSVRYSPLAVFGPEMRAALLGERGAPAQNLAIAKMVLGSSVIGYFMDRALSGQATGAYPTDPRERREWQLMGTQPNSIQADGQWISMERLGPSGNIAKLGADLASVVRHYNGQDDDRFTSAIWGAAQAASNMVGDEVGFQTLRNLVDIFENKQSAARFVSWELGSLMPMSSFVTQFASAHDPDMRQARSLVDGLKYRIPHLRETLLPKRDPIFGEPVPNPGYHTILRESPVNRDPVKAELDRIGYFPTYPQRTIGQVRLDDAQYDRYEATAGSYVKQKLQARISSPWYQSRPVTVQRALVKADIASARAKARSALQMDASHLIRQGIDARRAQISGQP